MEKFLVYIYKSTPCSRIIIIRAILLSHDLAVGVQYIHVNIRLFYYTILSLSGAGGIILR